MRPPRAYNPAPTAGCGSASPRAFTLLELLVALAMGVIIAGALYSSLRAGFRARTLAEAQVEPVRTAELATALLRPDFESARPANSTLAGPFVGTDTTGEAGLAADTVEFFTLGDPTDPLAAMAPAGGAAAGPASPVGGVAGPAPTGEARQVQIGLVALPGPGGSAEQCLVRRVTTNLLAQVAVEPYEEVLCRNVRSLNIRYYDGLAWQDSWDSTLLENNIPTAVEVMLELERPGTDGQVRVIQFPRVYLLSCSTLSAASVSGAGGTIGGAP